MNSAQPLVLEDIITPTEIGIWPLAPGWWLLLLSIVGITTLMIVLIKRHQKKWGYRKQALQRLKAEYQHWQLAGDEQQCLSAMASIVKRTAITAYPTVNIKSLYGQQWIDFLNKHTQKVVFDQDLSTALYQKHRGINIDELYEQYKQWIKTHAINTYV